VGNQQKNVASGYKQGKFAEPPRHFPQSKQIVKRAFWGLDMEKIEKKRPTHEELEAAAEAAAMPLHEILCECYHPHAMAIVTQSSVKIVAGDIGMPLDVPD